MLRCWPCADSQHRSTELDYVLYKSNGKSDTNKDVLVQLVRCYLFVYLRKGEGGGLGVVFQNVPKMALLVVSHLQSLAPMYLIPLLLAGWPSLFAVPCTAHPTILSATTAKLRYVRTLVVAARDRRRCRRRQEFEVNIVASCMLFRRPC